MAASKSGTLKAIGLRPKEGDASTLVEEAEIDAERGLIGDYHSADTKAEFRRSRMVTLIAQEALDDLKHETGISLSHADSRRNLLTEGIDLNGLEGKEFSIGPVRLKGTSLCHPCRHLESVTEPGVRAGLKMRGGLCADVLQGGAVMVGMKVEG